jgi:hypothetical protein
MRYEKKYGSNSIMRRVLIPTRDIPEMKEMKKPDDEIKKYVDNRVRDLDRKLSSVILKGVDLDRELSTVGRGLLEHNRRIDRFSDYDTRIRDLDRKLSTVGRGLLEHNRRIDGLSDYLREEIDKYISKINGDLESGLKLKVNDYIHKEVEKINGRLEVGWKYKIDDCVREEVEKQVTRINGDIEVLLEAEIESTVDELNEDVSRLQKAFGRLIARSKETNPNSGDFKYPVCRLDAEKQNQSIESNNFPESSQELTNSNYSLEDVLAIPTAKPKIKKRRGKENKITLIYDSPNPAKVELRPKDIGSLELTIYSRGMDAQEIREKTLVFDPYNPETNEKNLEIFLDETGSHYADNTLDSLIVSLNNPELNEYFGKHMSPHFKKVYDLMTNTLNLEFKGENIELTSKIKRVEVERNKKRSGYGAFSSGKKLFGALSPILFPLKLFAYLGRIIE